MKRLAVACAVATGLCLIAVPVRTDRHLTLVKSHEQIDFAIYHVDIFGSLAAKVHYSKTSDEVTELVDYFQHYEPSTFSGFGKTVEAINKSMGLRFYLHREVNSSASILEMKESTTTQTLTIAVMWLVFSVAAYLVSTMISSGTRLKKHVVAGSALVVVGVLFFLADLEGEVGSWSEVVADNKTAFGVVCVGIGMLWVAMAVVKSRQVAPVSLLGADDPE